MSSQGSTQSTTSKNRFARRVPATKTYIPGGFWQIRTNLQGGYPPYFANAQAYTQVDLALVGVPIENVG